MAHLTLLDKQDVAAARQREAFLRRLSARTREDAPAAALMARLHVMAEGASLLMALDQTQVAMEVLRGAVELGWELRDPEAPGLIRLALLGAIIGRVRTTLQPDRIVLSGPAGPPRFFPWRTADPGAAGALVAASLLSAPGQSGAVLHAPVEAEDVRPPSVGAAAVLNTLEHGLVPLFREPRPAWAADAATGTVLRLHERHLMRLRLMLANPGRRNLMALPGPLVDWPLLAVSIALRRIRFTQHAGAFHDDGAPLPRPLYQLFAFVEALAEEIERPAGAPLRAA